MSSIIFSAVIPVVIIGILILVHELGHFLVAKWCGVGVVKFAIGFGPALLRVKLGETEYRIGAIPLGGYVRMVGDLPDSLTGNQESDAAVREAQTDIPPELLANRDKWFIEKSLPQKAAIVFAGPLFNFVSAILFIGLAAAIYGQEGVQDAAVIGNVSPDSPAALAGLAVGDKVISISGEPVGSWLELASKVHQSEGTPLEFIVQRSSGEQQTLMITPREKEIPGSNGKRLFLIGIEQERVRTKLGVVDSLWFGGIWTYHATVRTYEGLWGMIKGAISPKELAGPIFIFGAASKQAKKGLENTLYFMALLSVSLAVLNLLPIPVLDGGHLMFFILEGLVGPISIRRKEQAQQVGLVFLLMLMGFAISNDIFREPLPEQHKLEWKE